MAIGDAALAAGMDILTGNEPANTLDTETNKTRDYIAERTSVVTPIEKGGTNATTASSALSALGAAARNALGFPIAIAQLSAHHLGMYYNDAAQRFVMRKSLNGNTVDVPLVTENMIAGIGGDKVDRAGDTITGGLTVNGNLNVPFAAPATSGYTVAYINNDGRISKGASSERYKKHIREIDPASLGDIFPALHRFQMRQGEGEWKYGWIAERLAENADLAPFVVYNEQGVPDSIDFIALLIAQNAQLHQQLDLLAQRLTALEAR